MKTILILEDNYLIRENIAEMLEIKGFAIIEAANGKEGLKIMESNLPDLILCDIMMPLIDGYHFLAEIKKLKNSAKIPFIFVSAISEKKEVKAALELGADDYITKPFDEDELIEKVNQLIYR
jgi:DNA-binding response OmpR family regulator